MEIRITAKIPGEASSILYYKVFKHHLTKQTVCLLNRFMDSGKTQVQLKILLFKAAFKVIFITFPPSGSKTSIMAKVTGNNKKINSSTSRSTYVLPMRQVSNVRLAEDQGNQKQNTHESGTDISGGRRPCQTQK